MLFPECLVVMRGGGDLASGVAWRLRRAGFPVVVLELPLPLAIRRRAAFASAVLDGELSIEGVRGRLATSTNEAVSIAMDGEVAVMVSPTLPEFQPRASVVVDARIAKRNIDTRIDQAPLVVGLGPGFVAGEDCHAVVETMRGHHLGRVIWEGRAAPDTGVPGSIGGQTSARVVRAPVAGEATWSVEIGDLVVAGSRLGNLGADPIEAGIDGVVRGLIAPGLRVEPGAKIGDIDPRGEPSACFEASDKARSVGGGVLEAVLTWLDGKAQ